MDRFWLKNYPPGVPSDVDVDQYRSLVALMEDGFAKHASRDAYAFMDRHFTFADIDRHSAAFGAWLQGLGLARGARVAIMMPNVVQYPIAVAGVLRAGYVVVNVNPLYTPRELEHQLKDSGAEAIVILENFAATLQQVIAKTAVKHVVVASIGDLLGFPKGAIVNFALRNVKKMVPAYSLPGHVRFNDVLDAGARGKLTPVDAGSAGRRVPAVHRRHHGRVEGRHAHAPQPGRERAADGSLGAAGARRHQPRPGAGAAGVRLRAAAVPRLRAHGELPAAACASARSTC